MSLTRTVTINNLPDEVLLEAFDYYRQSFGDQLNSEGAWNNKNGWFKLAHVCQNWRCVVLASSSRLQLRLFFSDNTPTRVAMLEYLSHLPIIVDYSRTIKTPSDQKRLISALRYPERVCGIAIRGSLQYIDKISGALDSPFPVLENLELHDIRGYLDPILPTSFSTSVQSLRHLLWSGSLSTILPLLSVTRALVDLNLCVDTVVCKTRRTTLFMHLQRLPHLRNLQVYTVVYLTGLSVKKPPITTTSLTKLSCFRFRGSCAQAEWFVAGLVAPSLQEFHISVSEHSPPFHFPCLYMFIRDTGTIFFAARLAILGWEVMTSMFSSAMLCTIEDIFLYLDDPTARRRPLLEKSKFFEEFHNVKVLRLHHDLSTEVADMLQKSTMNPLPAQEPEAEPDATTPSGPPMNGNGSLFTSDIFPSLEKIMVYARTQDSSIGEDERAFALESFGPFATARRQVGRPVKVLWSTDKELPRYFMTEPRRYVGAWHFTTDPRWYVGA